MNSIALLLPLLLNSFKGQERVFATTQGIALLTAENARVNAGLSTDAIAATVTNLVTLAMAEEDAAVAMLTKKLAK